MKNIFHKLATRSLTLIILSIIPISTFAQAEWVYLYTTIEYDKAVIVRKNQEVYIIQKGLGCLSLSRYENKSIIVYFPGLFGGLSGKIILSESNEECNIWNTEKLEN